MRALVAAGVIALKDAVPLVRLRAAAMQGGRSRRHRRHGRHSRPPDEGIRAACADAVSGAYSGEVAEPVNFNAAGQTVIAGHKGAVERRGGLQARGAKRAVVFAGVCTVPLIVDCPTADKLAARLLQLNLAVPQIPVINNVDVAIENDPVRIKDALVRQATNPVRWVETVQKMAAMASPWLPNADRAKVLAGLTKRCGADNINGVALADLASIEANLNLE